MGFPPKIPLGQIPGLSGSLRDLFGIKAKIAIRATLGGVQEISIDGTNIFTAQRLLPRKVHQFVRDRDRELEGLVARAQPLLGIEPAGKLIWGNQLPIERNWNAAAAVGIHDNHYRQFIRNSGSSKIFAEIDFGRFGNFHQILDPNAVAASTIIAQDMVTIWFGGSIAGVDVVFGFYDYNTALDPASLVGIGFKVSNTGAQNWWTYLRTGTGTPSTVVQETDTGVLSGGGVQEQEHRLAIVLDAKNSQVLWYIDGVLVDSYAPSSVPDQMGTEGTKFGYAAIVDRTAVEAQLYLRVYGGANIKLLSILREVL